jgi:hypothetical protein
MNWETKEGIDSQSELLGMVSRGRNAHRDEFFLVRKVEERDG